MSTQTGESSETAAPGAPGGSHAAGEASEEQLRAAYEAELSRIASADMVLQAAASLLNIGAYRLGLTGPAPGAAPGGAAQQRDLEQVRDAIDAVRGLLGVIERSRPAELRPLRDALSQLQMAYARETQAAGAAQAPADSAARPPAPAAAPTESAARPPAPGAGPGRQTRRPLASRAPNRVRGRRSRAAGCGCPGAERAASRCRVRGVAPAWCRGPWCRRNGASAPCGTPPAGRHDRLPPLFRRIDARWSAARSGRG